MRVAIWLVAGSLFAIVLGVKLWVEFTGVVVRLNGWTDWITALGTAGLASVALAALIVAINTLGDARATRHGQLVTDLSERWDAPAMHRSMQVFTFTGPQRIIELYERLYRAVGPAPTPEDVRLFYRLGLWPDLIETIGVFHDEKVLGTDIVYKMWGPQINMAWEVWREPVVRLRELANAPTSYYYFERLAAEMRKAAEAASEELAGSAVLTAAGDAENGSPPGAAEAAEQGE